MNNEIIHIYKKSRLPSFGWFQGCFICKIITANHMIFDTIKKDTEYRVYMCAKCERKLIESDILYEFHKRRICAFIYRNFT